MSLTRELLAELSLGEADAQRILAAHDEAIRTLNQEHEEALAAAHAEYAAYRADVEQTRRNAARRETLSAALTRFGANPQAIPLMLDALSLPEDAWNGDALADEGCTLTAVRAQYAPLFDAPRVLPTAPIAPPGMSGGPLTHDDLRRMSPDDINRIWPSVIKTLGAR